jgi:anaerobic selenocysteine-containing dehydrogenase
MQREDLFLVCHDMFLTETARQADVVLPGTSSLEMTDIYAAYGHYYLQMALPVIPRVGRSRPILEVFQDLARRFGFGEEVFSAPEEEIISWLLDTDSPYLAGITLSSLKQRRRIRLKVPANPYEPGFKTPSGKVEFFAESLKSQGLDALPSGEPSVDEQGQGRYRLQLITPTRHQFLNSTFNEVEFLRQKAGPATVMLHPQDARDRGIGPDDLVRVYNDRGQCLLKARITEDTPAGVTVVEGLYWGTFTPGGKGVNHLTSQRRTDLGGGCAFHCNLVEVEPA